MNRAVNQSELRHAQHYLDDFSLDPADLGDLLSAGKQHYTFRWQANHVIKIPKETLYMRAYGAYEYHDIVRDIDYLTRFLADFTVASQVVSTPRHTGYVVIQDLVADAQYITPGNFPAVRHDFERLLDGNRRLNAAHQCSVDFFGNKGFQHTFRASMLRQRHLALMTNLLYTEQGSTPAITIVDINLSNLRYGTRQDETVIGWLIDRFTFELSKLLLQDNFGIRL